MPSSSPFLQPKETLSFFTEYFVFVLVRITIKNNSTKITKMDCVHWSEECLQHLANSYYSRGFFTITASAHFNVAITAPLRELFKPSFGFGNGRRR